MTITESADLVNGVVCPGCDRSFQSLRGLFGHIGRCSVTDREVALFFVDWSAVAAGCSCWHWTGAMVNNGYGRINRRGKHFSAHRFAYEALRGEIPHGMILRHRCDVPSCVNPDHLEIGSFKENTQDAVRRGRFSCGERHWMSALTEDDVREIRRQRREGSLHLTNFAQIRGVSISAVSHVANGRSWKHIQ